MTDPGIFRPFSECLCNSMNALCFTCPDMDISADFIHTPADLRFGLFRKRNDFLRALFQKQPLRSQRECFRPPDKQLMPEFSLKVGNLSGESRL